MLQFTQDGLDLLVLDVKQVFFIECVVTNAFYIKEVFICLGYTEFYGPLRSFS